VTGWWVQNIILAGNIGNTPAMSSVNHQQSGLGPIVVDLRKSKSALISIKGCTMN
jgi:hypothetical protein